MKNNELDDFVEMCDWMLPLLRANAGDKFERNTVNGLIALVDQIKMAKENDDSETMDKCCLRFSQLLPKIEIIKERYLKLSEDEDEEDI